MGDVHYGIIVVELVGTGVEAHVVHQVQTVYRVYEPVVLALFQLHDHRLARIEHHAVLETLVPFHLHLNDKLTFHLVVAAHVYHTVLLCRIVGHHLRRDVLHMGDLFVWAKRQQGIEQAHHQVGVLAEHQLECQIGFGIQILTTHRCVFFL